MNNFSKSKIQPIIINPKITSKQKEVMRILLEKNGINEILYGGAAGGGKSFVGCLFLIIMSLKYPNSRWLMGRSRLTTLKNTTLKTFFDVCKILNLKETIHFKHNQQKNEIVFYNGSEIIMKDLFAYPSDPNFDSLGSMDLCGGFLDEVNQISLLAKNIVMSRIRYKLDEFGIEPKLLMSCNPAKNWVYNEFYKKHLDSTIESYKKFIQALSSENEFISKHYTELLNRQDDITKRRLLYGEWEYSDSLSLFDYDKVIESFEVIENNNILDFKATHMSIDVARLGKDSTCITIWNDFTVIEILKITKTRLNEQKDIVKSFLSKYQLKNEQLVFDVDGVGGGLADDFTGCLEVINNSRAISGENYKNLKTQLYFKLSEIMNSGLIKIKCDHIQQQKIIQELQVIKRENVDSDGKIQITSKATIKQNIGRSPDYSDSLAYRMLFELEDKKFVMPSFL